MAKQKKMVNPHANRHKIQLEISLSAQNLKKVAGSMKDLSDPYAILSLQYVNKITTVNETKQLGRTETIHNALSPTWTKRFYTDFIEGEQLLYLTLMIMNEIDDEADEVMGTIPSFDMSHTIKLLIEGEDIKLVEREILQKEYEGKVFITLRVIPYHIDVVDGPKVKFQIEARQLIDAAGGRMIKNPFLEIMPLSDINNEITSRSPIYRSEIVKDNMSPQWIAFEVPLYSLCPVDKNNYDVSNQSIVISVYDFDEFYCYHHVLIGKAITSLNQLEQSSGDGKDITLLSDDQEESGELIIKHNW